MLTVPQIAQGWGVSTKTVRRWELESVDKAGKFDLFRLADVVENRKQAPGDFQAERTRKEKELADKLEMENEVRRKNLLPADEVGDAWCLLVEKFKAKLLGVKSRTSSMVAKSITTSVPFEDVKRLENIIDGEHKAALSELSRGDI